MQTDVVTVTPRTTVAELMRVLSAHDISGVPVVDDAGVVVGVVSSSDVMSLAEWPETPGSGIGTAEDTEADRPDPENDPSGSGYFHAAESPSWQFPLAHLPLMKPRLETTPVADIMTPATFHVRPDATLVELARFLVRANIHRALVLEGSRLAGIVTSMDVLRAVADA